MSPGGLSNFVPTNFVPIGWDAGRSCFSLRPRRTYAPCIYD
jgi:hypothetical protein